MDTHTEYEVAESIVKQFPSTTITSIETSIKSYKKINAWDTNLIPLESSFTRLQDVMENAGELSNRVDFADITKLDLAQEVFS